MKIPMHSIFLKKLLLNSVGKALFKKLNRATGDIRLAQQRVLHSIINETRTTAFGKEHNFASIKTISDFRKAVPIRDFEGHRPYIDRMCRGETDVLIPGKPVFYNTTSGTSKQPKLIPISKHCFSSTYTAINRLWLYCCFRDNPLLFQGKNFSAVSPAVQGQTEDGTPVGSLSGYAYQSVPKTFKNFFAIPYPIICINDYQAKYYAMMRCALGTDISYIFTVNPSTLLQFHRTVLDNKEALIRDIHDGTLRTDVANEIDPAERFHVLKQFERDPMRASRLESVFQSHENKILPLNYWPNLVCVNTWKQANCKLVMPKLAGYFPHTTVIRELGYQSSEIRAGIVLRNDWSYSLLLAHMFLFEFIEVSARSQTFPEVLQPHELEIGKSYYILFSNGSGLYRYDINDIVRVTGFYRQFPLIEFIQKGAGVTSLTGEKLSEVQVIKAVEAAGKNTNLSVAFYTMYCDRSSFSYKLFIEFPGQTPQYRKNRFIIGVDEHLKYINAEYRAQRDSHCLYAPELIELGPNAYESLKKRLVNKRLVREDQYKVRYLRDDSAILNALTELAVSENPTSLEKLRYSSESDTVAY